MADTCMRISSLLTLGGAGTLLYVGGSAITEGTGFGVWILVLLVLVLLLMVSAALGWKAADGGGTTGTALSRSVRLLGSD